MGKADIAIDIFAEALQVWLLVLLINRQLYRRFPFFFTYIGSTVAITFIRLWTMGVIGDYPKFFIVFWSTQAVYDLLALLVLYEVGWHDVFE